MLLKIRHEKGPTMVQRRILVVVGTIILSACSKLDIFNFQPHDEPITYIDDGVTVVNRVESYRDTSQCAAITTTSTKQKIAGRISTSGIVDFISGNLGFDPNDVLQSSLTSSLSQDQLKTRFDNLASSTLRTVNDLTSSIAIDPLILQVLSELNAELENSRSSLTNLAANVSTTPYPSTNFLNEVLPSHNSIPNENFFDSVDLRVQSPLTSNSVTINFSRSDEQGVTVSNIKPSDIIIEGIDSSGKKVYEFNKFSFSNILSDLTSEIPSLTVVAVNDYSFSMSGDLDNVEASMNVFYSVYPSTFITELIKFTDRTEIFYPLSEANTARLKTLVAKRPELTSTAMYDAVTTAITDSCKAGGLKAILLLTDGQDNSSQTNLNDTLNYAKQNKVPIFIIGFGYADKGVLKKLADESGGFYIYFPYEIYKQLNKNIAKVGYALFAQLFNYHYIVKLDEVPDNVKTLQLAVNAGSVIKTKSVDIR